MPVEFGEPMPVEPENTVTRAIGGDRAALESLLERFALQSAAGLARRIEPAWRGVLEVDDVLQVTFLEAFLSIERCQARDEAGFFAWLKRIAEHNLIDAIRGLRCDKRPPPERRVEPDADESYVALHEQLVAGGATPSRVAAGAETRRLVSAAIARLPRTYAQVIRLFDLEGLPAGEVGRQLGRSRGAVHMLRARALARLAELLGSDSNFFSHSA